MSATRHILPAGLASSLFPGSAVAAPAPTSSHPDARLLALGAEMERIEAQAAPLRDLANAACKAGCNDDHPAFAAYDALDIAGRDLGNLIAGEPATTLDGFRVKARALAAIYSEGFTAKSLELDQGSTDQRLAWSILSGLLAIGGAA